MPSDVFRFKRFAVRQAQSAMKVGTDGVLLGAWVRTGEGEKRILDVGAGTGLIALMMAQRSPNAEIDAVEMEPGAAAEAQENAAVSPWKERITVHCRRFQDFAREQAAEGEKYDLIVSNPPYFIHSVDYLETGPKSRVAARHAQALPYGDLIEGIVMLLASEGRFAGIFPYEEAGVFIAKAATRGLYCKRMADIYPKPGKKIKRVAAEFSFVRGEPLWEELTIENGGGNYDFTNQYRELTKDFYLKF